MNRKPVALVTGGSRGIGRGICVELAKAGHAVLINYNTNVAAAEEARSLVESSGGVAEICAADVAQPSHRDELVDFTVETFGRIDLLVNNAGVTPPERLDVLETTESNFHAVLAVNLTGPFFLAQRVAQVMIDQHGDDPTRRQSIVNISSISAYTASTNRVEYCIAKAGLGMVTTAFAVRLAEYGIGVFEIRPGVIDTDMVGPVRAMYEKRIQQGLTPIRRFGQPQDVGKAVVAIATGAFPFSTGEVINVDGGFHLRQL